MLDVRHHIAMTFLLLLFTITATAQDDVIRRGCRVGTPRPENMALRRGAPGGQVSPSRLVAISIMVSVIS